MIIRVNYDEEKKATKHELKKLWSIPDHILLTAYWIKKHDITFVSSNKCKKLFCSLYNYYSMLNIEEMLYYDLEILEESNIKDLYTWSLKAKYYYTDMSKYFLEKDMELLIELLQYSFNDIMFLINCNRLFNYSYLSDESILSLYYDLCYDNIDFNDVLKYYNNFIDENIDYLDFTVYSLFSDDFNKYKKWSKSHSKIYDYLNYNLSFNYEWTLSSPLHMIKLSDISFTEYIKITNELDYTLDSTDEEYIILE